MRIAFALAGAAMFATTASAQAENIIRSVNIDDLEALALQAGHQVIGFGELGQISVHARTPTNIDYFITGTACEAGSCQGINFSSRYAADDTVTLDKVNQSNVQRAAVNVWLMNGTTLGISRYVILDGGMTEENVVFNRDNFLAIVPEVLEMFTGGAG
jgi:hypothetical protein